METRTAEPQDYDRIIAVIDQWWGREVSAALPRLFLDHFAATSRIAEDGAGIAGFLIGFRSPSQPEQAYIHFVGVRPDRRREGLARQLYVEFSEQARTWGCHELRAITAPSNTASVSFHQRLGFGADTVIDYNGPGRPMVVFHRLTNTDTGAASSI